MTGSFGGLTPVTSIDGRSISKGAKAATERLSKLYNELIANE